MKQKYEYERVTAVELDSLKTWLKWLNEYKTMPYATHMSGTLKAIADELAIIIERAG